MNRNLAITVSALVLLLVSVLFDTTGSFAGGPTPAVQGEAAGRTERVARVEAAPPPAGGSFGIETDRFEDTVDPEPDNGLAEDDTVSPSVQAFGAVARLADVPPPLRGTICNVPRIE
ncbi:hypothetical protein [Novosphingobium sp. B1]|uniref:hypothetical protein n=1 Tax=Novosphingobium sp. B1 TaxID=1938756 RepID=UPI0009D8A1A1|nr:hypothetical protein [Novosphingobium sp. B1]SMC98787.1 hypothetical protein SAMN06272759_11651 [Novosphingobium sp. B1]